MHLLDTAAGGEGPDRLGIGTALEADIENLVAAGAVKVGMRLKIRAIP